MTHFNHEWTNDTTPIPQAVGDRFYAQDLNDDFNYLKHLPYEAILQGRNAGVMIPPSDTWNTSSHTLSLSGGFGVVNMSTQVLDVDEEFVLPPKSITTSRIERVGFQDVTLTLPNDGSSHYIVATPTKRSLLQRTKALLSEQYASRIKYDGVITIQNSAPTSNQILVGMCHNNEYLLCKDFVLDQGKNTIKLHKWYGTYKITSNLASSLQTYYNSDTTNIETSIFVDVTASGNHSITDGTFNNCDITIRGGAGRKIITSTFTNCTISISNDTGYGIDSGTFNNCTITVSDNNNSVAIDGGTFNNCTITVSDNNNSVAIDGGTFNNCTINILGDGNYGIYDGTFNNCTINISSPNIGHDYGIYEGNFDNCIININNGSSGIYYANFNRCSITIQDIGDVGIEGGFFILTNIAMYNISGAFIEDNGDAIMYFVRANLPSVPSLSEVGGKGLVVNDTTILGF